jgi:redox-sensitive bicupin YhaK (pirin superfamily)
MITKRPSHERGHANHGWLDTYHTFSFANYYDPRYTGFRDLLVINEDRVAPGRGFAAHSHRDMEILTYVLEGSVAHKDSMGNETKIVPGEIQRMSAGTGVTHSEVNPSRTEPLHFLQIWITPSESGLPPSYEQRTLNRDQLRGTLTLIGARDGHAEAVMIHQDVEVFVSVLDPGPGVTHRLRPGRHAWVQVITGELEVNGVALAAGDGAAVTQEDQLHIRAGTASHVLLFDLA